MEEKIRQLLAAERGVTEKKMFGGLCFLHRGNMVCGITKEKQLMVRVGPEQYEAALKRPHAHEMTFTGRPMRGMVYVDAPESAWGEWVEMGLRFTRTLPKK